MTTTIIKTIKPGGGGDYFTINAAELANRQDLIAGDKSIIFDCYGVGNVLSGQCLFSTGWRSDVNHPIRIRAAAGNEHQGIWNLNRAYGQTAVGGCVRVGRDQYVKCERMQFKSTTDGVATLLCTDGYLPSSLVVDGCIVIRADTATGQGVVGISNSYGIYRPYVKITNSVVLHIGSNSYRLAVYCNAGDVDVYNSDLVAKYASFTYNAAIYLVGSASVVNSQDNYLSANACYYRDGSGTLNKGDHDATANAEAVTPSLRNVPYSTATFLGVTEGAEDLHMAAASALRGAGILVSGVTTDFEGDVRPNPPSIGADDVSSGFVDARNLILKTYVRRPALSVASRRLLVVPAARFPRLKR